jgi:ribosomal protein S18 acetylase RimI-like enzyme
MEILDLRQLRAHDLEPLLQEETRVWREQLRWDYRNSADLIRRFVDARSLPGYVALDDGRTVGYSFFVYEDYKGLIGNLFVSRPYCGATEGRLLTHVIETMQGTPGIRRIEAQLMTFWPGALEPVFRQEQFEAYSRLFMLLELASAPPLPARDAAPIQFLPWDERYSDAAAELIVRAYHHHVDSQVNDQYCSQVGALRFLHNIIHYPGCGSFHRAGSSLAFQGQAGGLCGLVLTSVVGPGVGHVTQVCVTPEFQGTGVGYELMRRGIESFRESGFTSVSLTVTAANRHAVRLYERMGFGTLKEFSAFVWNRL